MNECDELLPAPPVPELSAERHQQLKVNLMAHLQAPTTRARKRLLVGIAAPLAVAAAIATAVIAVPSDPVAPAAPPVAAAEPVRHIATVAYTLDRTDDDKITITVRAETFGTIDSAQLVRDLNAMGLPARLAPSDGRDLAHGQCQMRLMMAAERDGKGNFIVTIDRRIVDVAPLVIVFPFTDIDPADIHIEGNTATIPDGKGQSISDDVTLVFGNGPTCP